MFHRILLGTGAATLMVLLGAGCASQQGAPAESANLTNSTGGSGQAGALINQGRFPAPIYAQEEQPAYAFTGQEQTRSRTWAPASGYYQVGNGRVFVPPAP